MIMGFSRKPLCGMLRIYVLQYYQAGDNDLLFLNYLEYNNFCHDSYIKFRATERPAPVF
jgi:hypothetical protein